MILEAFETLYKINQLDPHYELNDEQYLVGEYREYCENGLEITYCLTAFLNDMLFELKYKYREWIQDEEILTELTRNYQKWDETLEHVRMIRNRDYKHYISDIKLLSGKYELGGLKIPEFIDIAQEIIINKKK